MTPKEQEHRKWIKRVLRNAYTSGEAAGLSLFGALFDCTFTQRPPFPDSETPEGKAKLKERGLDGSVLRTVRYIIVPEEVTEVTMVVTWKNAMSITLDPFLAILERVERHHSRSKVPGERDGQIRDSEFHCGLNPVINDLPDGNIEFYYELLTGELKMGQAGPRPAAP